MVNFGDKEGSDTLEVTLYIPEESLNLQCLAK